MLPFYVSLGFHVFWIIMIVFILPESLSTEARAHLRKVSKFARQAVRRQDALEREWEDESPTGEMDDPLSSAGPDGAGTSGWSRISNAGHSRRRKKLVGNARRFTRRMFRFAQPMSIFLPHERTDGRSGRDWNLTAAGMTVFCTSIMMVSLLVFTRQVLALTI